MANENRFTNLMGGLGNTKEPSKKAAKERPSKKEGKAASSSKSKPKSKDPDYTQISLYITKELHQKLKIGSAIVGKEMSDVSAEAIQLWLEKNVPNI